jgi:hypothetical protein
MRSKMNGFIQQKEDSMFQFINLVVEFDNKAMNVN